MISMVSQTSDASEPDALRSISAPPDAFARIVGRSDRIAQVVKKARVLAGVDTAVLLLGETGVGKEVFARAIHDEGPNRRGPFVAVNCGGLPRDLLASELFGYVDGAFTGARRSGMLGKVEAAHGGTLFLDAIAELPLDLQPYLLRVLEGGEVYPLGSSNKARTVNFRLIAATHRDLRAEVQSQRFRMDLFFRIAVTTLQIPPLRERRGDLPALVEHFVDSLQRRVGSNKHFSPEVFEAFARYDWPGNLRELRNAVEAISLLSDSSEVTPATLPAELLEPVVVQTLAAAKTVRAFGGLREAERETITTAIQQQDGNLTLVARELGISRSTLYLKLKKYGLEGALVEARGTTAHPASTLAPAAAASGASRA